MTQKVFAFTVSFIALCFPAHVFADLLSNGDFETMGASNTTFHSGVGGQGNSAAADWTVFHNIDGTTETNWVAYDEVFLPTIFGSQNGETDHVLRAEVSHAGNGLVQVFGPLDTGPSAAEGSIWIHTNPGQIVGVGIGNGGATFSTEFTSGAGGWEEILFNESTTPVNEMIIYADTSGAEFYVDFAFATASVPEPASAGVLGLLGMSVLGLRRKRRCI